MLLHYGTDLLSRCPRRRGWNLHFLVEAHGHLPGGARRGRRRMNRRRVHGHLAGSERTVEADRDRERSKRPVGSGLGGKQAAPNVCTLKDTSPGERQQLPVPLCSVEKQSASDHELRGLSCPLDSACSGGSGRGGSGAGACAAARPPAARKCRVVLTRPPASLREDQRPRSRVNRAPAQGRGGCRRKGP